MMYSLVHLLIQGPIGWQDVAVVIVPTSEYWGFVFLLFISGNETGESCIDDTHLKI
jgi:hypothetical protein